MSSTFPHAATISTESNGFLLCSVMTVPLAWKTINCDSEMSLTEHVLTSTEKGIKRKGWGLGGGTKTTWSDTNTGRVRALWPQIMQRSTGMVWQGTVLIGPPCYCSHHPKTPTDPVSLSPTVWSYLPAAPGWTFSLAYSGIFCLGPSPS